MKPPRLFLRICLPALAAAFALSAQQAPPAQSQQVAPAKPEAKPAPPGPVVGTKKGPPAVVSFGLMAGGHLRNLLTTTQGQGSAVSDTSGHLLVGPTLQIHWTRVTMELDALYRGYGTRSSGNLLGVSFENRANGRAWEFPLLLKRRFYPNAGVKPVIGAGVAVRYLGQSSVLTAANDPGNASANSDRNYIFGLPFAAGIEFKSNRFRFTPEFRYTLWAPDNSAFPVRAQRLFESNNNQFQLLMGFTF